MKKECKRIFKALTYSIKGIKAAWINEAAFRTEIFALAIASVIVFIVDFSVVTRLVLLVSVAFVISLELINSAIEAVVDRIGTEHHELSGRAKDCGSAAVFVAVILALAVWLITFADHFFWR